MLRVNWQKKEYLLTHEIKSTAEKKYNKLTHNVKLLNFAIWSSKFFLSVETKNKEIEEKIS